MLPYGSKQNDWDYYWTGREEIITYGNKINVKRARQHNREVIEVELYEIAKNQDLDDLDRLAEMYGDYYDDDLYR